MSKPKIKKYTILGRQYIVYHGSESNHRKTKSNKKPTKSLNQKKNTPHIIVESISKSKIDSNIPGNIDVTQNRSTITSYLHTNYNMYHKETS